MKQSAWGCLWVVEPVLRNGLLLDTRMIVLGENHCKTSILNVGLSSWLTPRNRSEMFWERRKNGIPESHAAGSLGVFPHSRLRTKQVLEIPSPFFPGILLSRERETGWFLKRMMVEKNGESTPRKNRETKACLLGKCPDWLVPFKSIRKGHPRKTTHPYECFSWVDS